MKLSSRNNRGLQPTNAQEVRAYAATPLKDTPYYPLLQSLGDMLDALAQGDDGYCIVGVTRRRDAVSITAVLGGSKDTQYAEDLAGAATACQDWL